MYFAKISLMNNIKTILFDADDTLWENETFFRESESNFAALFKDQLPESEILDLLFQQEMKNLPTLGYGVKGFIVSMMETATNISKEPLTLDVIQKIIKIGKDQIDRPVNLLPNVEDVVRKLKGTYNIFIATKGDLKEQEIKIEKSGIAHHFDRVEILSEKKEENYEKLLHRNRLIAEEVLMIGNSLKSDILPVLNLGAHAWHIPFHITWQHEKVEEKVEHEKFKHFESIIEVLDYLV